MSLRAACRRRPAKRPELLPCWPAFFFYGLKKAAPCARLIFGNARDAGILPAALPFLFVVFLNRAALRVSLLARSIFLTIAENRIAEVKRLLAVGCYSQRQIARMTSISRGVISAVKLGRRRDRPRSRSEEDDANDMNGPKERCPGCGGMTTMPCRTCRDRQALAKARRRPGAEINDPDGLNLQLKPETKARYEEVRSQRRQAELEKK